MEKFIAFEGKSCPKISPDWKLQIGGSEMRLSEDIKQWMCALRQAARDIRVGCYMQQSYIKGIQTA